MITSESIGELAKALAVFNTKLARIARSAENPFFKSQYTTLDTILDTVRPVLAENGISIMQMPAGDGVNVTVTTMLLHTSGEYIQSPPVSMKPVKNDPQSIGSAITYAKRYSLAAVLGISTGDVDDDGNHATYGGDKPQVNAPKPQATTQTSSYTHNSTAMVTAPQKVLIEKKVIAIGQKNGLTPEEMLAKLHINKVENLTKEQASKLIDKLHQWEG